MLSLSLTRKSVVRITDCPDIISAVTEDVKQHTNQLSTLLSLLLLLVTPNNQLLIITGRCYNNIIKIKMSRVVRKPAFCICENKDADQLRGNREADQRLCFRYIESTIPLLSKSEISSLYSSSMVVQPGLCQTWSQTPKTGFLRTRLKWYWLKKSNKYAMTRNWSNQNPNSALKTKTGEIAKIEQQNQNELQ